MTDMAGPPADLSGPADDLSASTDGVVDSTAPQTLAGQVVEGVEANCLLLDTGVDRYLLVIPNHVGRSAVRAGARLVVRGRAAPDFASHCQQGIAFLVSEVLPG